MKPFILIVETNLLILNTHSINVNLLARLALNQLLNPPYTNMLGFLKKIFSILKGASPKAFPQYKMTVHTMFSTFDEQERR